MLAFLFAIKRLACTLILGRVGFLDSGGLLYFERRIENAKRYYKSSFCYCCNIGNYSYLVGFRGGVGCNQGEAFVDRVFSVISRAYANGRG